MPGELVPWVDKVQVPTSADPKIAARLLPPAPPPPPEPAPLPPLPPLPPRSWMKIAGELVAPLVVIVQLLPALLRL